MQNLTKLTFNLMFFCLGIFFFVVPPAYGASSLENIKELRSFFGLSNYSGRKELHTVKIAVIDNGFEGYDPEKKELPASTILVSKYDPEFIKRFQLGDPAYNEAPAITEHGLSMAKILWGITGANLEGPRFFLLNANGITNFRRAVRYAIEEKVDIILYSQNRECCGNFDGGGFLNTIVNQAVQAGILWVNAAGNYGGHVYNDAVSKVSADGTVLFDRGTELRLKSRLDENGAQIILTWNSSGPEEDTGTDKDLDLYVYDSKNQVVAKSELKQVLKKAELGVGETFLPRERIRFQFSKNTTGNYRLVVKAKSRNFNHADRIRIVVIPEKPPITEADTNKQVDALEFLDATQGGEIMSPADNPGVLTVGDMNSYSAQGPTVDGRVKPEIILENSTASFSNGTSSSGTSNAAAYFAGIIAVMKSYNPSLSRDQIIAFPKKRPSQLGANIQKVGMAELISLHGQVESGLEDIISETPVLAGRYSDGRYVLGIRKAPKDALVDVCGIQKRDNLEYYLFMALPYTDRFGRSHPKELSCYVRNAGSEKEVYPWTVRGGDKQAYVEVRQVYFLGSPFPGQGVWMTPPPTNPN